MASLRRPVFFVALALAALALPGCDDGGGNAPPPPPPEPRRLYFGMHNWNDCEAATIDVDLEAAGAVLARKTGGDVDCRSDFADFCDVTIAEQEGGMKLHMEISGCFIDARSSLASCRFTESDIRKLEDHTFATCDCESERRCDLNRYHCDIDPYLCINPSSDPGSCEDCFNGVDDDGNGITDCDDPNCSPSFECDTLGYSTTVTCTDTSLPGTSVPDTMPVETVPVSFRLLSSGMPIAALQWSVDYRASGGDFVGSGGSVECASAVEGAIFAANDSDDGDLSMAMITLREPGVEAPADLVTCSFQAPSLASLDPENFVVTVSEASGPELDLTTAEIGVVTMP